MKLLLDTHTVIWWAEEDPRLSDRADGFIRDETTEVLISAVVPWEIAIKRALKKLAISPTVVGDFIANRAIPLPITLEHAAAVEQLPLHHGDPFDRLLLAQAVVEGASIVSADPAFAPYDVPIVW